MSNSEFSLLAIARRFTLFNSADFKFLLIFSFSYKSFTEYVQLRERSLWEAERDDNIHPLFTFLELQNASNSQQISEIK